MAAGLVAAGLLPPRSRCAATAICRRCWASSRSARGWWRSCAADGRDARWSHDAGRRRQAGRASGEGRRGRRARRCLTSRGAEARRPGPRRGPRHDARHGARRRARRRGERAVEDASVALLKPGWRDARWSSLFERGDTAYASVAAADPERVAQANRRGRGGAPPSGQVQGPMLQAPCMDVGGAGVLLDRRDGGRRVVRRAGRPSRGRRAQLREWPEGRARCAPRRGSAAADPGPRAARALLQHAADLQAPVAHVDGRVVPVCCRRLWPPRPWAPICSSTGAPSKALGATQRGRGRLPGLLHRGTARLHRGPGVGAQLASSSG